MTDDVTADTPKRTNHTLLLKQRQCLTLLVIQITPALHHAGWSFIVRTFASLIVEHFRSNWSSKVSPGRQNERSRCVKYSLRIFNKLCFLLSPRKGQNLFIIFSLPRSGRNVFLKLQKPGLLRISGIVTHCYEKVDHVLWLFSSSSVFGVCLTTFVVFKKNSSFKRVQYRLALNICGSYLSCTPVYTCLSETTLPS